MKEQVARINRAIEQGSLMQYRSGTDNFIDLVRGVAALTSGADIGDNASGNDFSTRIGAADHLVFVLVDGMGTKGLEQLPEKSFLRSHLVGEMQAVFPSTTACALTALASGQWPSTHGLAGWWMYLAQRDLSVVTLPYEERFGGKNLQTIGVESQELWPYEPWMQYMQRDTLVYLPKAYCNSTFARYFRGGQPGKGYSSVVDACERACMRVLDAKTPTFTLLYLPELDSICHRYGWDSQQARLALRLMDTELMRLAEGMDGNGRLMISADHGHMNVALENRLAIYSNDPILDLLKAPPSGEPRTPVFHVRPGQQEVFMASFAERFGDKIALVDIATVEALQLLGPESLSAFSRQTFGDFVGIALEPVTLQYYTDGQKPETSHLGYHAGLSPDEMRIPLIMA